jgi:hypothetical protein
MLSFKFLLDNVEGETGSVSISFNAIDAKEAYDTISYAYGDDVEILECSFTDIVPDETQLNTGEF